MRKCLTAILFVVLTSAVAAEDQLGGALDEPASTAVTAVAGPAAAEGLALPSFGDVVDLQPSALPRASSPQAAQSRSEPRPTRRRRGTMVGYIDDAIVESNVRLRFDVALENTVPDRAEFFYAKCGCYSGLPVTDPAFDPDAPGPPGAASDLDFRQFDIQGEYALGDRVSVFGQLPVRAIEPRSFVPGAGTFENQTGIGDVRAGAKLALATMEGQVLTAQARFFLPSGDPSKGMGTDHASFEPALLYYREVSDVVTLESQLGVWLPLGGSAGVPTGVDDDFSGRVLNYGIGSAFELNPGGRVGFAPVVELVGWRVVSGYQTAATSEADGTNIVNLKIGGRVWVEQRDSFYVGYGHVLTDAAWYDDIVRFEYRRSF